MIYRLTGGHLIGQIITEKEYSALHFNHRCVHEPVEDLKSYEYSIFLTNNRGAAIVTQHVFDFEDEVLQFLKMSNLFLPDQEKMIMQAMIDGVQSLTIETPVKTIKYTRNIDNIK